MSATGEYFMELEEKYRNKEDAFRDYEDDFSKRFDSPLQDFVLELRERERLESMERDPEDRVQDVAPVQLELDFNVDVNYTKPNTEEINGNLQYLSASITSENNEDNTVYQAELQKAIKDADLDLNTKGQELQKFQNEMSLYTQNVNNEIKEHVERIAKAREQWAQDSAKYQAELNKYSGEIQHNVQKVTNASRNAQQYTSSATTYFGLAMNAVKSVLDTLPQVSSE